MSMMPAHESIESRDLSSITRCTVGGQTMPVAKIDERERRSGAPLLEVWGMTELAGFGTTHSLFAPNVHGSIGIAFPGTEMRVTDPDEPDRRPPPGEPGELMIRGPLVMLGYFGNEQATGETIDEEGRLRTFEVLAAGSRDDETCRIIAAGLARLIRSNSAGARPPAALWRLRVL